MFKIPIYNFEKETVSIGDSYEFVFNVKSRFFGLEKKLVEWIVESTDKFEVENIEYNENGQLVVQTVVIKNPLPFLAVFGFIVAGTSIFLYMFGLQLDKVHKVITVPAGKALSFAVTGLVGFFIIKTLFF